MTKLRTELRAAVARVGHEAAMRAVFTLFPQEGAAIILEALDAAKGNRTAAAKALGIEHRGLARCIERHGLWPAVDELCAKKGYHVQPGPPRGPRPE